MMFGWLSWRPISNSRNMLTKISLHKLSLFRILRSLITQVNFLPEASISLRNTSPWVPEPSCFILLIRKLSEKSDA